jgi:hypothetical protein
MKAKHLCKDCGKQYTQEYYHFPGLCFHCVTKIRGIISSAESKRRRETARIEKQQQELELVIGGEVVT